MTGSIHDYEKLLAEYAVLKLKMNFDVLDDLRRSIGSEKLHQFLFKTGELVHEAYRSAERKREASGI